MMMTTIMTMMKMNYDDDDVNDDDGIYDDDGDIKTILTLMMPATVTTTALSCRLH